MFFRICVASLVLAATYSLAGAGETDPIAELASGTIESVRINLVPWGANLGFEAQFDGQDPRFQRLLEVIVRSEPGRGHKCPNRGAVRFQLAGGKVIAIGLLPSHGEGSFDLRIYDHERLIGVNRVARAGLLAAFDEMGVPVDDPAFAN